ncbi:MAG TPA: Nif3-like dinuclear metal center hexameric protein, partial [Nocardioides sp.]|nr:Nif3-like dinuclear metal center hexameric protein [Nocardioides sp.]
MPSLADVVDLLHAWYPPSTADSWDAVGLVAGDPAAEVTRVMFAVDPTVEVAREAVEWGADLLVVHHPLFLTPVSSVAADTPKGRTLHTLTAGGCALLAAHTNADQAVGGVSESLALALGLTDLAPIRPAPAAALDKVVAFVPVGSADAVRAAMTEAGAGRLGDYDSCTWTATGQGRFRPLDGATPAVGAVGDLEVVEEARVEAVVPRSRRTAV